MAGDLEQGIASDAAKTQTLLDKEFDKDEIGRVDSLVEVRRS